MQKKINVKRRKQQNQQVVVNRPRNLTRTAAAVNMPSMLTNLTNATKLASQLLPTMKKSSKKESMQDYAQQLTDQTISGPFATTPAVVRFARVYSDPFLLDSARIPTLPMLPSQLMRTYSSGTGITNASGIGWIYAGCAEAATNDAPSVSYSSGAAAPSVFAYGDAGTTLAYSDSTYASANYSLAVGHNAYRPVAFGIRVRYTGTTLNAAGTIYALQLSPPIPNGTLTGSGITDIKNYKTFKEYSFRGSAWHAITRHIRYKEDFLYQGFDQIKNHLSYSIFGSNNSVTSYDYGFQLGLMISATAGVSFEWEVVGHYEIIGPGLNRISTVNPKTDHVEKVISAFNKERERDTVSKDHSVGVKDGWVNILSKGVDLLLPMVPQILSALI